MNLLAYRFANFSARAGFYLQLDRRPMSYVPTGFTILDAAFTNLKP